MRLILACLLALAPLPAMALTCMPHSLETTFQRAAQADEPYVVVHGTLQFDKRLLPSTDPVASHKTPPLTQIPARLEGRSLSKEGFTLPFDRDVTLEVACYGPWCASAQSGQKVLAFVRRGAEGYVVETDPCGGGDLFRAPKPAMIRKVKSCYKGAECAPKLQ